MICLMVKMNKARDFPIINLQTDSHNIKVKYVYVL